MDRGITQIGSVPPPCPPGASQPHAARRHQAPWRNRPMRPIMSARKPSTPVPRRSKTRQPSRLKTTCQKIASSREAAKSGPPLLFWEKRIIFARKQQTAACRFRFSSPTRRKKQLFCTIATRRARKSSLLRRGSGRNCGVACP